VNDRTLPIKARRAIAPAQPRVTAVSEPRETRPPVSAQALLDFVFERNYLSVTSEFPTLPKLQESPSPLGWRRVVRLPVHPTRGADDLLPIRWQRMLTTLHAWNRRLAVVLVRKNNQTALYFGTSSIGGDVNNVSAVTQLERAAAGEMPGLQLEPVSPHADQDAHRHLLTPLLELNACGAITGLPSARSTASAKAGTRTLETSGERDLLGGLGQVAHGLKGPGQDDCDYAIVILAEAVQDLDITSVIDRLRLIGERVHSDMRTTVQESINTSRSESRTTGRTERDDISKGKLIGTTVATMASSVLLPFGGSTGYLASQLLTPKGSQSESTGASQTEATGSGTSEEHVNMVSQHCKAVVERHIDRLNSGRSFGFWNTGVYVLGDCDDTVLTVCGMLRAAYSGEGSHIEPIRSILFPARVGAARYVRDFRHVPLHSAATDAMGGEWHPLGPLYQHVSTPLNTDELAVVTALPRKDVPGLRTEKNQVQFALNGPELPDDATPIELGKLIGAGGVEVGTYAFDLNGLVRHGLLVGTTGSGKSTTCRRLIQGAVARGVPFLIIEPAKDDYARWVAKHNQSAPPERRVALYMPGESDFDGTETRALRLNPFEPAFPNDVKNPDRLGRLERVAAILNASMPMQEVLPILLEAAIIELGKEYFGQNFQEFAQAGQFPTLQKLAPTAHRYLRQEGGRYAADVRANLEAALDNRIAALVRGRRGEVFNVDRSTPARELFEQSAVINLSRLGSEADKALVMALLLLGMCEWRMGRYAVDKDYREDARNGRLKHLTVVEEAHTILRRPDQNYAGAGNPQAVVSRMFSDMLAEVRQYGQGLLVVDQDPALLITGTIKNTSFRIVHKLPHQEDRMTLAATMMLRGDQCDFLSVLGCGQAVISTDHDDAPCWVSITPGSET
jgi:hypothetical protein